MFADAADAASRRRPVLIGTTSVQQSEAVLGMLQAGTNAVAFASHQAAIQVLNAKPEKVSKSGLRD
jgi:preprotein translocase subunit SecA